MQYNAEATYTEKVLKKIREKTDTIGIELTTYCPLNCEYCARKLVERRDRELGWEDFMSLTDKLKDFKRVVFCGMGEPMAYRYLYEAVHALSSKKVIIITSGTVPIDYKKLNAKNNIDFIVFSVDYPSEEEMRRSAGNYNWNNLINNLKNARRVSKIINCTVTKNNFKVLPAMVEFAVSHKVNAISFILEIIREEGELLHEDVKGYLNEARAIARRAGVFASTSYTHVNCIVHGKVVAFLDICGELYPCCYGVEKICSMGNIFSSDFNQIWEGEAYGRFREGTLCMTECPLYRDKLLDNKSGDESI